MDPFVIIWTINMDLPSKIILIVEMKAYRKTKRDQFISAWCILRIYFSLKSK